MRSKLMKLIADYNLVPVFEQLEKDGFELIDTRTKFDFWENHVKKLKKEGNAIIFTDSAKFFADFEEIFEALINIVDLNYKD